ncbi:MAG: hypothetical protein SPH68_03550 [Candidatus Borkfalkiaceae bacterium]|nr:hypothetical protein [Clostridia bacterium]MDY6223221.1 hypothetical protein [Christensenellaceae bacterium]
MDRKQGAGSATSRVISGLQEERATKSVGEALLKAALGCRVAEVTEEYAEVDGELKLLKRKKTKKDIPPDLKAVQLLLETREEKDISALSDEELEEEKQRLLRMLYVRETKEKAGENKAGAEKAGEEKTGEEKTGEGKSPAGKSLAGKSLARKSPARKSPAGKTTKTRRKKAAARVKTGGKEA